MKYLLFFLCLFLSFSLSAQKVEHGALVGIGLGFPVQTDTPYDEFADGKISLEEYATYYGYDNNVKLDGSIGYRFRFLTERRYFFDLDATIGFQRLEAYKRKVYVAGVTDEDEAGIPGKSFREFVMPISLSASWNYKFTDKFHAGLGVAPTLYVQPQAVFDLAVLAKVGYRVSKHCELGLTYQYGCLDVLKHFNEGPALGRRGHLSDLMFSVYIPFVIK